MEAVALPPKRDSCALGCEQDDRLSGLGSTACVRESLVEKMQKGRLRPRPSCVEASLCLRRAHVCRTRRSLISGRSRRMPPMGEVKRADQPWMEDESTTRDHRWSG